MSNRLYEASAAEKATFAENPLQRVARILKRVAPDKANRVI
jgi:hypothetical protein